MMAWQMSCSKQKFNILKVAFVFVGQIERQRPSGCTDIQARTIGFAFRLVVFTVQTKAVSSHSAQTAENSQAGLHQGLIRALQCLWKRYALILKSGRCISRAMKLWLWGAGNWAINVDLHIKLIYQIIVAYTGLLVLLSSSVQIHQQRSSC